MEAGFKVDSKVHLLVGQNKIRPAVWFLLFVVGNDETSYGCRQILNAAFLPFVKLAILCIGTLVFEVLKEGCLLVQCILKFEKEG